jgi:hypothetical protein
MAAFTEMIKQNFSKFDLMVQTESILKVRSSTARCDTDSSLTYALVVATLTSFRMYLWCRWRNDLLNTAYI